MQLTSITSSLPQMNENNAKRDKTLEKIATAHQLNMEDSSSHTIASQLQNEISTYSQEFLNANESIAMAQITDGALSNLSEQSQKLNDLSIRNSNPVLSSDQQQVLATEFQRTQETMQSILETTSYNENPLLDSSLSPQALRIDDQNTIDSYRESLASKQSDVGAAINNFISSANSLLVNITNASAAKSQIADTDMAQASTQFSNNQMQLNASQLAMAHQMQVLQQSISRLLG